MDAATFDETLRAFAHRTPFRPFAVELVSGSRVDVDRADAFAFRRGVAAYLDPSGTPTLFDCHAVARLVGAPPDAG